MYNSNGRPIWYLARGKLNNNGQSYQGPFVTYTGGRTLQQTSRSATLHENIGDILIQFSKDKGLNKLTTAAGRIIPMQRFEFAQ
jgi:hypothetical protein